MTAMNTLMKQPTYVKIAAAATVAAGAAAVYHEHERRKTEKTKNSTTEKKKSKTETSPDKPKKSKKSSSKSPESKRKSKASSGEKTKTKTESTDKSPTKVEPISTPAAPEPKATTGNKKIVVLISSYGGNIQIKTNQERAFTILKGMKVEGDQLEVVDGAVAPNREKRNELFGVSGIRAKYPQFFVVDQTDKTHFVANWEDFEAMNDMGSLKKTLNLAA